MHRYMQTAFRLAGSKWLPNGYQIWQYRQKVAISGLRLSQNETAGTKKPPVTKPAAGIL
jgi:hypothetical protein